MKQRYLLIFIILCLLSAADLNAQGVEKFLQNSQVSGNFEFDGMYYNKDSLIGAADVPQKALMNTFANINYTNGPFSAGLRFENYLYALQGFDPRYKGIGVPYRYVSFEKDKFTITLGNSYPASPFVAMGDYTGVNSGGTLSFNAAPAGYYSGTFSVIFMQE